MTGCCHHGRPSFRVRLGARELVALNVKVTPPEGGWDADSFRRDGVQLIKGLTRLAKVVQRTAGAALARVLRRIMVAQVEEAIRRGEPRVLRVARLRGAEVEGTKVMEVLLSVATDEDIWAKALDEVLRETGLEFALEVVPPIQSAAVQGLAKTSLAIGSDVSHVTESFTKAEVTRIGRRIVGINETTRTKFRQIIRGAIKEKLTVPETAKRLRQKMVGFTRNRINTIARTEVQSAWTRGAVQSMQASEVITHVSVIGCESREEKLWGKPSYQQFMYRGESTCNIENVPVGEANLLNFHPNHTGVVVPSRFRDSAGTDPDLGSGLPTGVRP